MIAAPSEQILSIDLSGKPGKLRHEYRGEPAASLASNTRSINRTLYHGMGTMIKCFISPNPLTLLPASSDASAKHKQHLEYLDRVSTSHVPLSRPRLRPWLRKLGMQSGRRQGDRFPFPPHARDLTVRCSIHGIAGVII